MQTKCIIFGEALKIRVKKFKHSLRENYSKSTKITITPCKISGGVCPRTPRELFLFLNQLHISSVEKKNAGKKVEIMPSPLLQFLATPLPALVVSEKNLVIDFGPPTLEMLPPSLTTVLLNRLGQLEKFRLFQIRLEVELELHSFSKLD